MLWRLMHDSSCVSLVLRIFNKNDDKALDSISEKGAFPANNSEHGLRRLTCRTTKTIRYFPIKAEQKSRVPSMFTLGLCSSRSATTTTGSKVSVVVWPISRLTVPCTVPTHRKWVVLLVCCSLARSCCTEARNLHDAPRSFSHESRLLHEWNA